MVDEDDLPALVGGEWPRLCGLGGCDRSAKHCHCRTQRGTLQHAATHALNFAFGAPLAGHVILQTLSFWITCCA